MNAGDVLPPGVCRNDPITGSATCLKVHEVGQLLHLAVHGAQNSFVDLSSVRLIVGFHLEARRTTEVKRVGWDTYCNHGDDDLPGSRET